MASEPKKDAILAVTQMMGNAEDNLFRAASTFEGFNEKEMKEQYGESGKSRAEIMRDYNEQFLRWKVALEWLEKQAG